MSFGLKLFLLTFIHESFETFDAGAAALLNLGNPAYLIIHSVLPCPVNDVNIKDPPYKLM